MQLNALLPVTLQGSLAKEEENGYWEGKSGLNHGEIPCPFSLKQKPRTGGGSGGQGGTPGWLTWLSGRESHSWFWLQS